jgi:hypothetical protein
VELTLEERREQLEKFAKANLQKNSSISLSPVTDELAQARKWFHMGVGLD